MARSLDVIEECPPVRGDHALIADGWTRRYLADAARAEEARELYASLGLEVLLRAPEPSQVRAECQACEPTVCRDHFLVYTRRRDP
jgi:hypothetical protein